MDFILAAIISVNINVDTINMSREIYTPELQNRVLTRLGELESSNDYHAINRLRYVGKYQFGAARLQHLKYIKSGCYEQYKNSATFMRSCLTGKGGFVDIGKFFINKPLQEKIARESLDVSYKYMLDKYKFKNKADLAGYLMAAHLSGDRGAYKYVTEGKESQDANGTKTSKYYKEGYSLYK